MAKVKVDMTGVESSSKMAEGTKKLRCVDCEVKTSQNTGDDMVVFYFQDKAKAKVREYCSLGENGLWKLKQVMEAMGLPVKNGRMVIDTDKFIGKTVTAVIVHDDKYASIDSYVGPDSDMDDDEDEDDAPRKSKAKAKAKAKAPAKKAKKKRPDPDEDEWDEDDDEEEDADFDDEDDDWD